MIKVTFGNNMTRSSKIVNENTTTLRSVLEEAEIDYSRAATTLDGATLVAGDMDKTFAQMGVTSDCYLLSVQKLDNAR